MCFGDFDDLISITRKVELDMEIEVSDSEHGKTLAEEARKWLQIWDSRIG